MLNISTVIAMSIIIPVCVIMAVISLFVFYIRREYFRAIMRQPPMIVDTENEKFHRFSQLTVHTNPSKLWVETALFDEIAGDPLIPHEKLKLVPRLDWSELIFDNDKSNKSIIGEGSFGIVVRASWCDSSDNMTANDITPTAINVQSNSSFRNRLLNVSIR